MVAYFFDTSGIVKRYIQETGSLWVQAVAEWQRNRPKALKVLIEMS
jgi:hypothetical protein